MDLHWHLRWDAGSKQYYAHATGREGDGQRHNYFLHCDIMNFDLDVEDRSKYVVDHINHNDLDNRECNLRVTKRIDNNTNRKSKNSNNKSGYRNVFWNTAKGKWSVYVSKHYKQIHIGDYDDVDEAGKAAEEARQKYYGDYAGKS